MKQQRKRRAWPRVRFGLKSLMVLVTLVCVLLAILAQPVAEQYRQERLLKRFVGQGVTVTYGGNIRRSSFGHSLISVFSAKYGNQMLYRIDARAANLTDRDVEQLSRLQHLQRLNLDGSQVTNAGLRHLRGQRYLSGLILSNTRVTDEGVSQLATLPLLDNLQVAGTAVTYDGLAKLDAALPYPHFCQKRAIEELKAAGVQVAHHSNYIDVDDAIRQSGAVRDGEVVSTVLVGMKSKPVPFTAAQVLQLNQLGAIEDLNFHTVTFDDVGLTQLAPIAGLKRLEFWRTNLRDQDLQAVGQQRKLENLEFHSCEISDAGLAQLSSLTKLKGLRIDDCPGVTKAALGQLRGALPGLD